MYNLSGTIIVFLEKRKKKEYVWDCDYCMFLSNKLLLLRLWYSSNNVFGSVIKYI